MPRLLRYLRIAWTAGCGIAAVLLIVMWVRSYKNYEVIGSTFGNITSVQGTLVTNFFDPWYAITHLPPQWFYDCGPIYGYSHNTPIKRYPGVLLSHPNYGLVHLELQSWLLLPLLILSCAAPWQTWLRFSFSLRTLLLATTAFAVLLGLVVYLQ